MTTTAFMKNTVLSLLIGIALGSHATVVAAPDPEEADFLGKSEPEPPRPVRKINKLPGSVSYKKLGDKRHQYQVTGLYADPKGRDQDDCGVSYVVPDCVEAHMDRKKLTCAFVTSRKLSFSELAYALDDLARGGGEFPYWEELEARDLSASEERKFVNYSVALSKEAPPKELAWFGIPREGGLRLPIAYAGDGLGTLLVLHSTAYCCCHDRYSFRILDHEGKVIWKDDETVYGGVKIALSDPRGSEIDVATMHRVWISRLDHWNKEETFVISGCPQDPVKNAEEKTKSADKTTD